MRLAGVLLAAGLTGSVQSHTIFVQLEVAGKALGVGHGVRVPSYDGPQTDVTSQNIACNGPPNPTSPSDKIIQVKAGTNVTAIWRQTLTSGAGEVMDPSHKGPTLAYMKKVTSALTDKGPGAGWFNVQRSGFANNVWSTETVIKNQGRHVIHIPECIEDGQYLLRAEMIALHGARTSGGAQLYMECAQLEITGGTGSAKPQTYSIPGIYKANDPGLVLDIYSGMKNGYTIPGPASFVC